MKLVVWKYFSVVMVLMLALGTGAVALTPVPVKAEAPPLRQWVQTYGFAGYYSEATAIAVDASTGNVYVTGWSDNGTSVDYATVKYSPTGAIMWTARYNRGTGNDEAYAIALDSSGNAYVTGWSQSAPGNRHDYATVKYRSSDGHQEWVTFYTVLSDSEATAIAVDSSGNAYVTGYSDNNTGNQDDYATVKYQASDGATMWPGDGAVRYNRGAYDQAKAIAVDDSGNVYVTGSSSNGSDNDYATIKYNTSGVLQWEKIYSAGNDDQAKAIALDGNGNAYVTGSSNDGIEYDYATLKYDSANGATMWSGLTITNGAARYDGGYGSDVARGIAIDASGNAYVTGRSNNAADNEDYATLKYNSSNGVIMWSGPTITDGAARYNGQANGSDVATAIAVDSSGNAYITGISAGSGTGYDFATLKYNSSNGAEMWVVRYSGTGSYDDNGSAIALDGSGSIYVTGRDSIDNDTTEYATIKYGTAVQPTVSAVNPVFGLQGQCPMTVVITGTNLTGATTVSFGTGVTVSNIAVNSATQITATICIDASATPGAHNVSVTTSGGTATLTGGFTVVQLDQSIGTGAPTSHGSSVAGPTSPAPPVSLPSLVIQSASISAKTVTPGTPITVTADISNKSAVNGNKKITLYVNGQVETTQGITVNSGGSTKLTFNVSRSEPGDYTVYVDGVPAGSFKVELFRESDGILIFSAIMLAGAFVVGMVMLRRRQQGYY